jgi:hypothetical protein
MTSKRDGGAGVIDHTVTGSFASRMAEAHLGRAAENIAAGGKTSMEASRLWQCTARPSGLAYDQVSRLPPASFVHTTSAGARSVRRQRVQITPDSLRACSSHVAAGTPDRIAGAVVNDAKPVGGLMIAPGRFAFRSRGSRMFAASHLAARMSDDMPTSGLLETHNADFSFVAP